MTKSQAEEIARNTLALIKVVILLISTTFKSYIPCHTEFPGVVSVIPNHIHKLHTTRSWDFIGIHHSCSRAGFNESNLGEGTIIGVIDSGSNYTFILLHITKYSLENGNVTKDKLDFLKEFGQSLKVLMMKQWEKSHQGGKEFVKWESNSTPPIATRR